MPTDRHGRTSRVDNDPRRRPPDGYRVRGAERFRRVVGEAVATLPDRYVDALGGARLAVEEVPPAPPAGAAGDIVLAAYDGAVLTVYRRPIEIRAESRGTLEDTIVVAVGQAVARRLGWDDDIDTLFD